jgi:hypothetical protein
MKKVISVCFFIVLAISLLLIGLESGNAQVTTKDRPPGVGKPPKVEEKWSVTIAEHYNLRASNLGGSNIYTDNDFVSVRFSPPSKQCACYGFHLRINSPANQTQGDYAIAFDNVATLEYSYNPKEGTPCVLPGLDPGCLGNKDCADWCITNFLNNNPHPSHGYLRASIWIQLGAEIVDNLPFGIPAQVLGDSDFIYFSFYNGDPAIPEQSSETIYHEVYGFTTDLTGLWLTKESTGDKWIIEVNQSLDLKEQYREEYIYHKGKKEKTGTRLLTPLEIETSLVSFKMTWAKVQPN